MPECDFCSHPISAVESGCEQTDIKLYSHEAHKLLTVGEVLWSQESFLILQFLAILKCVAGGIRVRTIRLEERSSPASHLKPGQPQVSERRGKNPLFFPFLSCMG